MRPAKRQAEHDGVFTVKAKASIIKMAMRPAKRQAEHDGVFTVKAEASIKG